MPEIHLVEEHQWKDQSPHFDKYTALRIINTGNSDAESDSSNVYDFYINMDNLYLKAELKNAKCEPQLAQAQFKYGMVLVGLALLQKDIENQKKDRFNEEADGNNVAENNIEGEVEEFSRAIAPVIIPMINSLGSLSPEDEQILNAAGEAV